MTTRQRLRREHIALRVHNMRLTFGVVIRGDDVFTARRFTDTCIDCGWTIEIGDHIVAAAWSSRPVTGFYAHTRCRPLPSEWLTSVDFPVIIGNGDFNDQRCASHDAQVTARALFGDFVRYVCPRCVEENSIR